MKSKQKTAVICAGVSGCGKSTIGALLAAEWNCAFLDGDHFHSQENIHKMSVLKQPLTDADRAPWLQICHEKILQQLQTQDAVVLACSALKIEYRLALCSEMYHTVFVFLDISKQVALHRLQQRAHHFFDASLLDSQFSTLQIPKACTQYSVFHIVIDSQEITSEYILQQIKYNISL